VPRRPRLPRPKLRRPNLPRPKPPNLAKPKLPDDLWFRFVTRLRAIFYWTREKLQIAWRALRSATEAVVDWWALRSRATKQRIIAVAGVVVLYGVIKFAPIPGVPCQVSAAKECAPPNDTIAFVPANAALYAHFTVGGDSHEHELVSDLGQKLPSVSQVVGQLTSSLATPSGNPINVPQQVLPWAKDDVALTLVPGPAKTTLPVFIVGVADKQGADQFLASIAPVGKPKHAQQNGAPLDTYPNGFATAFSGDELLFGNESAVRIALDAEAGKVPRLEGSDQEAARDELPDVRFAEIYLSRAGVQRLLVTNGGAGATQLETFVDYGATSGMAASATARDDGVEFEVVSELDKKLLTASPTFFASLPDFQPDLADEAGSRALGYIGVGEVGPTVADVLAGAGAQTQGLAGSLRTLAQSLQRQAGVDPLQDLLPALGGQAALVAEPTDGVPFASVIVDGVDEDKATKALAGLQRPLLRAIGTANGTTPSFNQSDVDGIKVSSVQVSPSVNLSYAIFDGKLVVSTDPTGIAQVRENGDGLAGTNSYERATEDLPDEVSALVFLNLDEVLGLAEQAGLAEDPLYASLSDDISKMESLGLSVNADEEQLRSELFVAID
jgi:hypothetical protein